LLIFKGAIITSSGLVDVILYTLTRRNLIIDSEPSQDRSYSIFPGSRGRDVRTHLTTITADPNGRKLGTSNGTITEREGSEDKIFRSDHELAPIGKVHQETTIEVTTEPAYPSEGASRRSSNDFDEATSSSMWK
jgi:hypothetical protein